MTALPTVGIGARARRLLELVDDHRPECACQGDGPVVILDAMTWRPGHPLYRSSDFNTPTHTGRNTTR